MDENATVFLPPRSSTDSTGSSELPGGLHGQVRRRVRLLALFITVGFGVGPVLMLGFVLVAAITGARLPEGFWDEADLLAFDVPAIAASVALWRRARDPRVAPRRLLTEGILYVVFICFVIGFTSYWSGFRESGAIVRLTWIPGVVILFPLVMPGPPRRMLVGAVAAAAMAPGSLAVLHATGLVTATPGNYGAAVLNSGIAVFFAHMGARTVYGLGRQVARARQMGSYRLQERLGGGGMGEVWRATHRLLARPAAVKLIRPEILGGSDPASARRRFEREAQATAALRSPHTVELFDFGVSEDGTFYYVMELLDGMDMASLVREHGPVPAERAAFLLQQACRSLSEAHGRGIIHRDVKPANLYLCRLGDEVDFVKVLDFGLAKTAGPDDGATGETKVAGTPAFLAPEQALGREIGPASDLYALGCVAYWLLSGQTVFDGTTPLDVVTRHVHDPPVPVSQRTELPVPEGLEALVMACLEKDPRRRPASARALHDALGDTGLPAKWTPERAGQWWALHLPRSAGRMETGGTA